MIEMRLHPGPFEAIKSGKKLVEFRLYDEKRRELKVGDLIEFSKRPDLSEKIKARIVGLLVYGSFADLYDDIHEKFILDWEREAFVNSFEEYYPKEEQAKFGVVGIRFETPIE